MVRAAGHRPCSAPLSGMPLGIVVVVVGVCCRCCRHTVRCHYRTAPAVVVTPCLPAVPLAIVVRRHRRCLAAPHAIVHRRCTVVPLSRRWIRRRRLPPSSLLRHLRRRAVGRRRHGATGRRRRFVFASPGLLPSLLGVAVPCTRPTAPLCHPTASVCVVAPLCTAVVVVRSARALRGGRPFYGAVPGPWAC